MIRLTIDGQSVSVPPGTTVLDAAKELGIEIPTLCFVRELEPAASCFLCAVQVEGRPNLSPSCALPVAEGMSVITESEDVRAARKMALELLLSDHAGDCVAPCQARCPAGLDIAGFVYQLANGKPGPALNIIHQTLALPGALGRVCPRLCEQGCRRCDLDEGLAIASLHRYPVDLQKDADQPVMPPKAPASGKRVAIVGAGPAGLAAAFYLLQLGHDCTLYDAQREPGGMLRYGIPAYRLPPEALSAEVEVIRKLGAEFRMQARLGTDYSLDDLRAEYDAVFLGIGAWRSQTLRCPGDDLAVSGIDLLEQVAKGGRPNLGDQVLVIGGGNTAMDVARTAVRLDSRKVRVLYRRTRDEMPCLLEEVEAAEEEGVDVEYLIAPTGLQSRGRTSTPTLGTDSDKLGMDRDTKVKTDSGGTRPDWGRTLTLACQRMELGEPDESGRRRPVPIEGSEFEIECSAVVAAIGQSVDTGLARSQGLDVSGWGIASDPRTLATNLPGVFAGGDAVLGADLAVRAIAAGRVAAVSIDQYVKGRRVVGIRKEAGIEMRPIDDSERAALFRQIEKSARPRTQMIEMGRRLTTFDEIDLGLTEEQISVESRRCMSCGCRKAGNCLMRDLATEYQADPYHFSGERRRFIQDTSHPEVIYEPGKCIMCDACVKIAAAAGEHLGVATIGRGFQVAMGVPFDDVLSAGLTKAALRAVEACPTGALALRTGRSCDLGECGGCHSSSERTSSAPGD